MSTEYLTLHIEDLVIDVKFYYEKADPSVGCPASVSDVELAMDFDKQGKANQQHIHQLIHEQMEKIFKGGKHG